MVTATTPPPPVVASEHQPEPRSELLSAATSASIAGAFSSLSNTLLTGNARTLEDLVKDMMKPMLKTWLDDNLPSIVERLVKAEIERVARGGR
jgi:cell pole-organizing protein PopZ